MSGKRNWGDNMTDRRDGKEAPEPFEEPIKIPSKLWKKKYDCKRNKGPHSWAIDLIKYAHWNQQKDGTWLEPQSFWNWRGAAKELPYWVQWHCTACNKKDYEWSKLSKKFDRFRETINAKNLPHMQS